jgi:hypothetical protein
VVDQHGDEHPDSGEAAADRGTRSVNLASMNESGLLSLGASKVIASFVFVIPLLRRITASGI